MGNSSCPVHEAEADPIPFYSDGNLVFKAHHVGWIISGFFAIISATTSFWLIYHHLTYYTDKRQQRHIVRLLLMVPIYGIVSFLSYVFYQDALYFELIRDCYEAFVIASFFYLLLAYLGETEREVKEVFRDKHLEKWMWPFGWVKYRPSGLYFLQLQKWGIMQYVFIRPASTLAAVVTNYIGLYCIASYSPVYSHIWITVAISVSVSVAMYCVLQLYVVVAKELKPFSPIIKFLCIKSVVFLTFWQASFLSVLSSYGAIKATKYMTADDVLVGLNALLETFEMVIFAFLHIRAFTYLAYRPEDRTLKTSRWKSLGHALDFRDFGREFSSGSSYMFSKMRGLAPDGPDREKDFEVVMGKRREREVVAPHLSAAEWARRKVGEEAKWGIGSDGTRDEEVEEDVWDSGMEDLGYEEDRRRARAGRGERGGGDDTLGREARIAGLTDWYDARHPELGRKGQHYQGGTGGRNAAGRGANGPNRTLTRPPNSPQPSLFPSRTFAFNYVNPDLDPGVDERLNRRLEAAAISSAASSNDHSNQIAPPLPSPIILLRPSSPAQSEIDRRHFNGRSRREAEPKPKVVEEGGGGWWGWFGGGRSGGESEQRVEETRAVDDGLTVMPPSASQSRRERSGKYVGLSNEEEVAPVKVVPKPSFNIYSNPPPIHLQRPSFPIGPNSLRIYNAPAPLSPTYTHRHLPSISSPSSTIPSPLVVKPPARHRESGASYVSAESPLDRFSNGSALDNPDGHSPHRSGDNSEAGTFGPTRPSSPSLLAGMELPVLDFGSPNSFMTALSSPAPLSPSPRRQSNPFFPPQPPIVIPSAPPPPPAPQVASQHRAPPPPPPSRPDSSPPTRQGPRSVPEASRLYIPESRAVPRKIILPTPLSPARYPILPSATQILPPRPDRSSLRPNQPPSDPNGVAQPSRWRLNPPASQPQQPESSRRSPNYDPRFPNEVLR